LEGLADARLKMRAAEIHSIETYVWCF